MNIFSKIKRDHDEARHIMNHILETPESNPRLELFSQLKVAILSHAKSEEETFYKSLRKNGDKVMKDEISHFKEEHKDVEKLFGEIEKLESNNFLWWEKFGELRQALLHHMKEEEKEVFPDAKKQIPADESKYLGQEMDELEEKLKDKLIAKSPIAA